MKEQWPFVSIVVPTHDRSESLRRTLDALQKQTYPLDRFEVIVVADGCTDETAKMLGRYQGGFDLVWLEQPGRGAATARNKGVGRARGELLVFLDDDMEPVRELVAVFVTSHRQPGQVIMGYAKPVLNGKRDFCALFLRSWWESKFYQMRQPGHRFTYQDMLSGNCSLETKLFARVEGFDESFPACGGEDYEMGIRLLRLGARFVHAPEALAYHHEIRDAAGLLSRRFHDGRASVITGRRHPAVRSLLPLARFREGSSGMKRVLRKLAWRLPRLGSGFASLLQLALPPAEKLGSRGLWLRLMRHLGDYWYWRGVFTELSNPTLLERFLQESAAATAADLLDVDLRSDLQEMESCLEERRPDGARIRYGRYEVGDIAPSYGAEPLRGPHLRYLLCTELRARFLAALALEEERRRANVSTADPVESAIDADQSR